MLPQCLSGCWLGHTIFVLTRVLHKRAFFTQRSMCFKRGIGFSIDASFCVGFLPELPLPRTCAQATNPRNPWNSYQWLQALVLHIRNYITQENPWSTCCGNESPRRKAKPGCIMNPRHTTGARCSTGSVLPKCLFAGSGCTRSTRWNVGTDTGFITSILDAILMLFLSGLSCRHAVCASSATAAQTLFWLIGFDGPALRANRDTPLAKA